MKYKPGDKVRIKSLDWFNTNRCSGPIICDGFVFLEFMSEYCGKELTIDYIYADSNGKQAYVMKETNTTWRFTDGMIEGLADEEPQEKMVSLDKVCDVLHDMLHNQWINDAEMVGTWAYYNMEEFMEDFCKKLEE
jgi:hypothetical protein